MQGRPGQQSAFAVQTPAAGTHAGLQRLPTQGLPQQSALVAQADPGAGGAAVQSTGLITQRGIPSVSRTQHFSGVLLQ